MRAITLVLSDDLRAEETLAIVKESLENDKAIDTVVIDLAGKTTIADYMVVTTGTSERHIVTMAEKLQQRLAAAGRRNLSVEGLREARWVLLDAGDVVVHLFRAETRALYDIERLWSVAPRERLRAAAGA
ncbi:Ribosomal silencing factor RsfS [bacterium HR40]|nr:Ribosomal silencing factor RsfS [bacterium HR40]